MKPTSRSTSIEKQIMLYLGSFFLPPMGIWWGMKYIMQGDQKSKIVGLASIVITVISLVITYLLLRNVADAVNTQMSTQVNSLMNF